MEAKTRQMPNSGYKLTEIGEVPEEWEAVKSVIKYGKENEK